MRPARIFLTFDHSCYLPFCVINRDYHTKDRHRDIHYSVTGIFHASHPVSTVPVDCYRVFVQDHSDSGKCGEFLFAASMGLGQTLVRALVHEFLKTAVLEN